MKPVLPASKLPEPVSVDRVRLIRRSMRCFVFGMMGAVPLLGVGMACLTLRLQRQVADETGEPLHLTRANQCSIAAFILALSLLSFDQDGWVLALGLLLAALQGGLLFRQYQRAEPPQWNPARHLLYWGAGLAYAGLVLSSTIIMLNLVSAIHKLAG